jgi:hypothetical protein
METVHFDLVLGPLGQPDSGISWLFVRRCFFIAFFGSFDDIRFDIQHPGTAQVLDTGVDGVMEYNTTSAPIGPSSQNMSYIQHPVTDPVPVSGVNMTHHAGIAENASSSLNTNHVQHPETALVPFSGINTAMKRNAETSADGLHADNVIHFLTHNGAPLGYQRLSGDAVIDQEEVKLKARRYIGQGGYTLYVENKAVSPDEAFHAATRYSTPERIYVVPHGSINVFLSVRQWNSYSRPETRAERARMNTSDLDEESDEIL